MRNPLELWRESRSPFRELQSEIQRMQSRMEHLFDDFTPRSIQSLEGVTAFNPLCDIIEDQNNYYLKFDIPGVSKDQVKVELADNTLTVTAERKEEKRKYSLRSYLAEISYGKYIRSFTLPNVVNEKKIIAQFEDGVLSLTVPKEEATQPQQIAIH